MENLRVTKVLPALVAGGVLLFGAFHAQTQTANLPLQGTVASAVSISVDAKAGVSDSLDLTTEQTVADLEVTEGTHVRERSNVPAGYTVTVSSANIDATGRCTAGTDPCLYDTTNSNLGTDFQLFKGTSGTDIDFSAGTGNWSDVTGLNLAGTNNAAEIGYTISSLLPAGTYTETLTFTIASK